jgi:hypothetical protein
MYVYLETYQPAAEKTELMVARKATAWQVHVSGECTQSLGAEVCRLAFADPAAALRQL